MASEISQRHPPGGGSKDVTSSGTAEALMTSDIQVYSILVTANLDNQGYIYVGPSDVHKTTAPYNPLAAGYQLPITAQVGRSIRPKDWYIDADNDGEGVTFTYLGI